MPPHTIVEEWDAELRGGNPLTWDGYAPPDRETVVTGRTQHYAFVEGRFEVLGGSMGAVHGERVVRAYRRAVDDRLPIVLFTASGGARMQEGMVALVQMARTASAAAAHRDAGLLSVAVHRHPTTGGVFASYGSLADVRAASPGATIGFAGPRVVEQLLDLTLPPGSHTAESAHSAGLVDALVPPEDEGDWIDAVLGLRAAPPPMPTPFSGPSTGYSTVKGPENAWEEVQLARDDARPTGIDVALALAGSWVELRGADPVVRAGLATIDGRRVVVVAHDRRAGAGRPGPAGFRLARRAFDLAGRLGRPVVAFVDTPGAEPGPEAEAAGVAREIAETFAAMAALPTASVAVCVGEGGSGGALAFAHADRLLMLRHAVFSVIGPEGAAAILERDSSKAESVAGRLCLTSADLIRLGIADGVIDETLDSIRVAVVGALEAARPGERLARTDAATRAWLTASP